MRCMAVRHSLPLTGRMHNPIANPQGRSPAQPLPGGRWQVRLGWTGGCGGEEGGWVPTMRVCGRGWHVLLRPRKCRACAQRQTRHVRDGLAGGGLQCASGGHLGRTPQPPRGHPPPHTHTHIPAASCAYQVCRCAGYCSEFIPSPAARCLLLLLCRDSYRRSRSRDRYDRCG